MSQNFGDDLLKQIRESLMQQVHEKVETLYCADHGKFAQIKSVDTVSPDTGEIRLEFVYCCEELHAKILEVWSSNV